MAGRYWTVDPDDFHVSRIGDGRIVSLHVSDAGTHEPGVGLFPAGVYIHMPLDQAYEVWQALGEKIKDILSEVLAENDGERVEGT